MERGTMNETSARVDELLQRWREASLIGTCAAVLEWEQQTTLPAQAHAYRGEQLSMLAGLRHQRMTDPRIGELLAEVEQSPLVQDARDALAVNVREIRRDYDKAVRLPKALVEEMARTFSVAQAEWAQARQQKDFRRFEPWLAKSFALSKEKAQALSADDDPYQTLLDEYEAGAKASDLKTLFGQLREKLVPLVDSIAGSSRRAPTALLHRRYPVDRQEFFGEMVAHEMGFDFTRGRLDRTTHPFCATLGPHDCRILTRYNEHYFNESFFSVLHEAGHGMYEQGVDPEHFGTPMGEAISLGIHESQSRFWENLIGRCQPFWRHYFPKARGVFHEALSDVTRDEFYFAINAVAPSLIRVEADEVTYNLHILIRFELEQALLSGDLSPGDVPTAWNEKYKAYLGITPPDDALGCLQDVHWSAGLVGYFPTYTLGNIYAAQFHEQAEEDLGGIDGLVAAGRFVDVLEWLRVKIHRHGKRYTAREMVEQVTGKAPGIDPLVRQLRAKFGELYDL